MKTLNDSQYQVVSTLSEPSLTGLYLVQGPPGTGKTFTIVTLIHTILQTQSVCTEQNDRMNRI